MEEKKYSEESLEKANAVEAPSAVEPEVDDDAATAEEMEAFIRDRREREKKEKKEYDQDEEVDIFGEHIAPENSIDPYLEPDPTLPWVKYDESVFLSRGCKACPESYVPISEIETRSCSKVTSCNWMRGIRQPGIKPFDCVEVRFKNNRKDFFRLPDGLDVTEGDVVAVEGTPGHDIGIVSLTGEVCRIQMKKRHVDPADENVRKLFRRAKSADLERWVASLKNENQALLKTRRIAQDLNLEMKVNDVEYQGDNAKAIFYYTADDRVDFRTLIKVLAEEFHVRIEMKQIGARQEAGRIGGTGPCGRELCCATWMKNFSSVSTTAARLQDISLNPQKLAGMCAKLKCCLNYEVDCYMEAGKKMPAKDAVLQTADNDYYLFKQDIIAGIVTYSTDKRLAANLETISAERAQEIIEMNKRGEKPLKLTSDGTDTAPQKPKDLLADADIARFDKAKKKKKKKNKNHGENKGGGDQQNKGGNNNNHNHHHPKNKE